MSTQLRSRVGVLKCMSELLQVEVEYECVKSSQVPSLERVDFAEGSQCRVIGLWQLEMATFGISSCKCRLYRCNF